MERMKKNRCSAASVKALCRRGTALLLDACMLLSMFGGLGLFAPAAHAEQTGSGSGTGGSGGTSGVTRQADPSTMDTYKQMLDFSQNTRYAGRLWSDKTVFALGDNTNDQDDDWNGSALQLDLADDGVTGSIGLDEDFLHVYSALGSSQAVIGVPPVRTVIVFDNSGSMYSQDSAASWEENRIAKTVDAINAAIDMLMLTSQYNEVSVVLFGDGANNAQANANTFLYEGNSTAVTILPMKHYEPCEKAKNDYATNNGIVQAGNNTQYLKAGWNNGKEANGAELDHEKKTESGWVFVDNDICKLKASDKKQDLDDNEGHTWFKSASWTGWNNCGNKDYTAYQNGTTNIQAGMYQGMQELLKANKTEQVGNVVYQCVPSLVVLTDGAVTDGLENWLSPKTETAGTADVPSTAVGFVNDFSYKGVSFTQYNDPDGGTSGDARNTAWNQFMAVKATEGADPKKSMSSEVTNAKLYYELVASADAVGGVIDYEKDVKYTPKEGEKEISTTKAAGASLAAMQELANQYRDDEAYMIFTYLLTTAYYKQAVKSAYNVKDDKDWDIYTITVDMNDPTTAGFSAGFSGSDPKQASVTSNPAMMDPGEYFNTAWLMRSKYLNEDSENTGNTCYDDYTVGDMTVEGIRKAIQAWDNWKNGQSVQLDTFRSIQSGWNFNDPSHNVYSKVKYYDADGNPVNQSDTEPKPTFPAPGHGSFFRVYAKQTTGNGDFYIPTLAEATKQAETKGFQLRELNYDYVTKAYYANVAGGSGRDLASVFVEIMDAITEPLFNPVGGTNDLGVENAVTYMDPVGKYMDVKDVKKLVLFGQTYDITKTAVYDYQWNHQYMVNEHGGKETNDPITEGWYKGTPGDTNNFDVECSKEEKDRTKLPGGCETAAEAWDQGWVYRLSYMNASEFVPTLSTVNNPESAGTKMQNTEYTFYRIANEGVDRNELHINPAYLKQDETEEDKLEELKKNGLKYDVGGNHLKTSGVYALSDLRIWVEDSGDFSDNDVETGGVMTDANFDEALWINIPANMLPLRTVTVNLGNSGASDAEWTYTTNVDEVNPAYKASFPLRVFYTVGVSDEVLETSNRINIAGAIKAEYTLQNKIVDEAGHTARNIPESEGDVVEFFSNWYNPLNRYNAYVTVNNDYTFGDPVTTFSPASDNRYYAFEKALPLYSRAFVYLAKENQWRRVEIKQEESADTRTFLPADFGGVLLAQDLVIEGSTEFGSAAAATDAINTALEGKVASVTDGDIVLLKDDLLDDVTRREGGANDPFPSENYFYLPIEYYDLDAGKATMEKFVITRKGSEFGSAYETAHITNGDMLCWHDLNGNYPDYPYVSYTESESVGKPDSSRGKDYIGADLDSNGYYKNCDKTTHQLPDEKPNEEGKWQTAHSDSNYVVCAKPGGLRVGNLAQSVQAKSGTLVSENNKETADAITEYFTNRYKEFPEKIAGLTWDYYANNVTRTANNYYVPTISNESNIENSAVKVNVYLGNNGRLYVADTTLLVTKSYQDPETGKLSDTGERFNYQVYLRGVTGALDAIVVRWNDTVKSWQRQYHYIDLELDGQLFLQTLDGNKAMVDVNGSRVTEGDNGYVYANGAPCRGGVYYVYIGKNKTKEEIGASDTAFRVYHNSAVDLHNVADTDVTTGGAASGERVTFRAAQVFLVRQDIYDTQWNGEERLDPVAAANFNAGAHGGLSMANFELMTLDPNANAETTEILIDTPYLTNSAYWTQTVTFGENANPDGDGKDELAHDNLDKKLTEGDLYDGIVPSYDYPGLFNEKNQNTADNLQHIADNTAEFTLGAGEALLFNGLPNNTVYRVTEKLTDAQLEAGYTLKELSHNQQQGSVSTYRPGIQSLPVYLREDATYGMYYGTLSDCYPTQFATNETEKDLIWALDSEGNQNDETYLTYEPFHHTNAVLWEYYVTMAEDANGDNHHQPAGYLDAGRNGTSPFYLWDEDAQTSAAHTVGGQTWRGTVADNPSCYDIEDGGADEDLGNGQVRHYMFRDGAMVDQHYQGEGSGYIRNIARYLVTPTVHFGVKGESQKYAAEDMKTHKQSADYNGVYSAFGNTGTFEESANFVNTIQKDKVETKINGENTEPVDNKNDPNTYPGVQAGNTITYQIKWANDTDSQAHVVIIDQLDKGVDFVGASDGGTIYNDKDAANAALRTIYNNAANTPELDSGHVVIWDLGMQDGGANGAVTLTVQVNEDADKWWDYDGDGVADAPAEPNPDDYRVRDRATVRVADNTYFTNTVENPVGEPDKTETHIDRGPAAPGAGYQSGDVTEDGDDANLKPGEDGKWHGPLVFVGDTITYEIEWRNYESTEAVISIRDPLDAHVSFVSASYDPTKFVAKDGKTPLSELVPPVVPDPATPQTLTANDPDHQTDATAGGYGTAGTDTRPAIQYDPDTHTVTWNLGKMPAGASGKVTLVVKVEQSAAAVGVVDNTAYVQVGNEPEQKTRTMENPVPEEEKEERDPGDGVMVGIGDTITYAIHWQNYRADTARVIVMDTLDPGVDFVEADNGGVYHETVDEVPASGDYTETVTIPARTVVWVFENQSAGAEGTVTLTVRVNKDAKLDNTYNGTADGFEQDGTEHPDGKDLEVFNQARVKVGNDGFLKTDIVENPVPEKTETTVDHQPSGGTEDTTPKLELKPGTDEATYTGPRVFVGDEITYEISWKNGHDTAADVVIVDELDPGVDFVSANNGGTYDAADHTVTWNLGVMPAGASGKVTLIVKVNEKATPAGMVDNQASVNVNGDPFVKTEIIENPTPKVEKTEVSPGEGMQVAPGDEIEYKIDWRNYEEEPADVVIIDKLDPGVDFVSATADGVTLNAGDNPAKPTEANLTVRLEGGEGVGTGDEFTFTLELTAPDGGPALAPDGYTWQKTDAGGTTGTWKDSDKTLTLKAGESLTVQNLPVGTKYTLTPTAPAEQEPVAAGTLGLYGSTVTVKAAVQQPAALMDTAPVAGGPEIIDDPQPSGPETAGDPAGDPVDAPTGDPADDPAGDPANIRQKSPPASPEEAGSQPAADGPAADSTPNPESSPDPESSPAPGGTETTPPAEGSQDEGGPGSGGTETTPPAEGSQDESSTGGTETTPPDGELNPQPTDDTAGDDPDTGLPGTGAQGGSAQDTAGNTDGPANGEPQPEGDGLAPGGPETAVTYVFTAQIEDLPAPGAAANDLPMPMANVEGFGSQPFDPDNGTLDGEKPSATASAWDNEGRYIYIYYYKKAHTVVWVLKQRPAGAEGSVRLKVRVNENADKLWSYDHPTEGPSDTDKDDRVRNQAGVSVGNDALVKTRIIENPTEPQKTETNINDTDVSRDLVADEDGYVGPQVHVGDTITYRITWQNNAVDEDGQTVNAKITITDTLYDYMDFVEASAPGRYDADTRTVTWDLGIAEPGARGYVTLRVRVNAKAETTVENQATVQVGNSSTETDKIENPVEKLSSLVVKKTVDGNAGSKAALWHFHVVVDQPITGLYGEMNFTNGVADFTLTHGQECKATDLPADITYTVTEEEADLDGYETDQTGESDTIPAGGEKQAEFINSKTIDEPESGKGHLIVTKTVMGSAGDVNRVWHFRVELSDPGINGTYGDMTFAGGVAEFTLKHGQSAAALNLPAGITYTVTEVEADRDGYATTKNGAAGTIPAGGTAKAEFLNRKDPTPPPPDPEPTPTPSPTPTPEDETTPTPPPSVRIPQTGDDSPLLLWVVLLAASALGLCVTVFVHWSRKGRRTARQRKKQ